MAKRVRAARVVIEGASPEFTVSVRLLKYEVAERGRVLLLTVPLDDLDALRGRFQDQNAATNDFYRATIPGTVDGQREEVLIGRQFETTNDWLKQTEGRKIMLSAWPSELAEAEKKRRTRRGAAAGVPAGKSGSKAAA
jgi:hypothetical protein